MILNHINVHDNAANHGTIRQKQMKPLIPFGVSYDVSEMALWQVECITGWTIVVGPNETRQ